jgi:hypothetical protein
MLFSYYALREKGAKGFCRVSSIGEITNPIPKDSMSMTSSPPKGHPLSTIALGIRTGHMNFKAVGHRHSDPGIVLI